MQVFSLTSFSGGISDYNDKGIAGSSRWSSGLNIRSKEDSLHCQQALKQEGSSDIFKDLILWFVPAPDNCIYGFGDNGYIYKRTAAGVWSQVYRVTETSKKIKGACLGYRYVSANSYQAVLYWCTDTRLHRKPIPGQSVWMAYSSGGDVDAPDTIGGASQTYPKTNLTSASWHPMQISQQFVLIGNGNHLAGVSIEDGSYTTETESVPLPPHLEIQTMVNRGDNEVVLMCNPKNISEQVCLYAASMVSNSTSPGSDTVEILYRVEMSMKKVQAAIDGENFLMVADDRVWYSNLYNKLPICDITPGATCNPGGVAIKDNVVLMAISGATRKSGDTTVAANGIYAYGRNRNAASPVLNLEYPMLADELGGMCVKEDLMLVGARSATEYRVYANDPDNKQVGEYESLVLSSPYTMFPNRARVDKIVLRSAPIPEGCSVDVYYRLDERGDFKQAQFVDTMENQNSLTTFTSGTEATWNVGENANYIEVKVKLTPSGDETPDVKGVFIEVSSEQDYANGY